jgi:hypothetical protein
MGLRGRSGLMWIYEEAFVQYHLGYAVTEPNDTGLNVLSAAV